MIFINQLREKVGVLFGSPEVTTGGRALKFYSSMRLDVRKIESIKQGDRFIGNHTRVKVVKNKVAPPFKQAEFDIMFGKGISKEGDILDCAVEQKIIDKAGSWFSFEGERIGQGRENVKKFLAEHPDMMETVQNKVYDALLKDRKKDDDDKTDDDEKDAAPQEFKVDADGVIIEE